MCSSSRAPEQEANACWQLVGRGNGEAGSHQSRPLYLLLFIDLLLLLLFRIQRNTSSWQIHTCPSKVGVSGFPMASLIVTALPFRDRDVLPRQPGSASVLVSDADHRFGRVFVFFRDVIYQLFCPCLDSGYLFVLKCHLF